VTDYLTGPSVPSVASVTSVTSVPCGSTERTLRTLREDGNQAIALLILTFNFLTKIWFYIY